MIPLYKRHLDPEENEAVQALMFSGELSQGSYIEQLEEEFAKYVGAPYVVAVGSCTNAIRMCLDYKIDVEEKSGIAEIPAMTFVSVANEITRRPERYEMDGFNIKLRDTLQVGEAYNILGSGIWDCAHLVSKGMYQEGTLMCFSLYPGKPISGAEGGLIATDNAQFVEWARSYRQCGRTAYGASYDVVNKGLKANMTNLQACIGLHALRKIDENKAKLEKVRKRYNEAFGLENTSDYVYRVNIKKRQEVQTPRGILNDRDMFIDKAASEGIATSIHFKPIYYFEHYKGIWDPKDFPNTEKEWQTTVSIPFYPDLTTKDQDTVIKLVKEWIS